MTPSSQWGSRTTLQYSWDNENDTDSAVNTVLAVISIVVLLEQVVFPSITVIVILVCQRHKKAVQIEGIQEIVKRFRDELDQFDQRHPVQTPDNYSPEMLSEIADIEKRLVTVVDNLRAERRRQKVANKRKVYWSRVVSFHSYVSLILWVVYIAVSYSVQLEEKADMAVSIIVTGIIFIPFHYCCVLIESGFCNERQYITNLSTVSSAVEHIDQIRTVQPDVCFRAECYHYETRTREVTGTDSDGNTQSRVETYQEKVVTANITEQFVFRFWRDHSQAALVDIHTKKITKIKMELQILCGDAETAEHFNKCYSRFQDANRHRDVFVDFSVSRTVPGFVKRLAAYVDASAKAWWINSPCFWLSTVFWLGWIYRRIFNYSAAKTTYDVIKLVYINRPIDSGKSADGAVTHHHDIELRNIGDNGDSEAPDYPLFVNSLKSSKSNIEALLRTLETSNDEDNMPLKLVNDTEYMHVVLANRRSQLREAAL